MAQRDEEQPQAPDLGAAVQLETGESLVADGDADPLDAGYVPADRPYALDEDGVTGTGMHEGDTLDQRLAREQPEDVAVDQDRAGRIAIAGEGAGLETSDALEGVDVGIDGGAASAEEAAVHETTDPGGGTEFEPAVDGSPLLADPEVDRSIEEDPDLDRALADAERDAGPPAELPDEGRSGVAEQLDQHPELDGSGSSASGRGDLRRS